MGSCEATSAIPNAGPFWKSPPLHPGVSAVHCAGARHGACGSLRRIAWRICSSCQDRLQTALLSLNFPPSLTDVHSKELEALQKASRPKHFRLHRLWAVDFDWKPGKPFNHHRTRKHRRLKTVSDAELVYERGGNPTSHHRPLRSRALYRRRALPPDFFAFSRLLRSPCLPDSVAV